MDERVLNGDNWLGRYNRKATARNRREVAWVAGHHLVILLLSAVVIALVVAFGR